MIRNDKKFRRTINEGLGLLAIIGGALVLLSVSSKDVDPENPKGREICYLSEKDKGLPVTTRDVGCRQVVYVDENNNFVRKPILPKRVEPFQDYCVGDIQRNEDGTCDYIPPKD